ncbi:P5I13 protein, partial [Amia calva]|nr:P5I13 protein [Amia calva]
MRRASARRPAWVLLCLALCSAARSLSESCDDGKRLLERDLPPPSEYSCPGPTWIRPHMRLPSVDTQYYVQRPRHFCMDTPVQYNETIPNSGPHRPMRAQYGEYRYCPPQRWVYNLELGGVVFLYHPCVQPSLRAQLAALARSCVPKHIITPFPGLSPARPLALVSWGRTLEMSHVALSELSDWLQQNMNQSREWPECRGGRYRLMLVHPATLGSKHVHSRGCAQASLWALSQQFRETPTTLWGEEMRRGGEGRDQRAGWDIRRRRRKREIGSPGPRKRRNKKDGNKIPGSKSREGQGKAADYTGPNDTEQQVNGSRVGATHDPGQRTVQPGEARDEKTETGKQPGHVDSQTHGGDSKLKGGRSEGVGCTSVPCACSMQKQLAGGAALRQPTPRTEEAFWAAAALGFLLVLLTLSVLHTRLYRHWHRAPSLYWPTHDDGYDSVAEVIRRRLKMGSRRKRRVPQGRREESSQLLPASSSEELD